jgi:flagellar motor switch protein FliM
MLEIGQELVSVILDLLMGGAGKTVATGSRELTPVEIDLLEKPLGIVARDLTRAWSPFVPGEFARTTSRFAQSVNRLESLLVIRMQLTVGEISGSLRLTVPPPLTRLVQRQSEASRREPRAASAESEQAIRLRLERELLVEVDCELHGSSIRLKDLIDLKVGTVLDLGVLCDGAITVCVNGRPKFRGLLTQAGSKMAVSVG